ncbi:LPD7 domain-containing protein, partial [Aeromonas caviae]
LDNQEQAAAPAAALDNQEQAAAPAAALDNQEQAAAPAATLDNQEPEENAVEPFIERKIETADADVRAWLTNSRQPIGELIEEDERKAQHRPQAEGEFSSEPSQTPKGQASNSDFEATTFKPIVPEKVAKSYIEVDGKYYFGNRPDSLAFVDKGAKLQTKLSSEQVAASMVDIAEARGWTELQLSGTEDFRRAAWLEAASRGLASRGYKPKEEDLARLKKLTNDRTSNEIEPREQADVVPPAAKGKEQPTNQDKQQGQQAAQSPQMAKAAAATATADKQQPEAAAPAQEVNRLAGKLVEHGKAPYEHNPDNNGSYFVTLENADGQQSTTWGVGLEKAIEESQAEAGQHVELENLGRKPVQVEKQIKDEKGNVTGTKTVNSYRNEWAVKAEAIRDSSRDAKELVKEHPDLINEITAVKLAGELAEFGKNRTLRFSGHP